MRKYVFIFALFIMLLHSAFAQEYYADLTINILPDGTVVITGITNDVNFASGNYQEFTSKKGTYWLFNISSEKQYSDYILAVTLPQGAEFNYLKASGRSRVSYDNGIKIVASGTGTMDLVVQYSIHDAEISENKLWLWFIIAGTVFVISGFFLWKKFTGKRVKVKKNDSNNSRQKGLTSQQAKFENINVIKKTLAENQEKIIDLLIEAGGELVQKQLQHRSGLPKATLSRNVDILAKKGIIRKQSRGMTNMIILNKDIEENQNSLK